MLRAARARGTGAHARPRGAARGDRCTLWEAQSLYLESHQLYLRQWIALQLQGLYRGRQARRELARREHARWFEARVKRALGYWRTATATRCFEAWRDLILDARRKWESAKGAAVRMFANRASRAFNKWRANWTLERRARAVLERSICAWADDRSKAFRTWRGIAAGVKRAWAVLRKAAATARSPEMRWAFIMWQELVRERAANTALIKKVLGASREP